MAETKRKLIIVLSALVLESCTAEVCMQKGMDEGSCTDFQDILCSDSNDTQGSYAYLRDGRRLSCRFARINNTSIPRPAPQNETAPQLDSFTVGCHDTYRKMLGKKKPVLDLTWTVKESTISDGYVDGFYIVVEFTNHAAFYKASLLIEEGQSGNKSFAPCIRFCYNCYGSDSILKKDEEIKISVYPLPRSKEEDESNGSCRKFRVPGKCKKRKPMPTNKQVPTEETTEMEDISTTREAKDAFLPTVLLPILLSVILITVVIAGGILLYARNKKKLRKGTRALSSFANSREKIVTKQFLMIAKSKDHENAHRLAEKLRNQLRIQAVTNWEHRLEISNRGLVWYLEYFKRSDVLVFINTAQEFSALFTKENVQAPASNDSRDSLDSVAVSAMGEYFRSNKFNTNFTIFLVENNEEVTSIRQRGIANTEAFVFEINYSPNDEFVRYLLGKGKNVYTKRRKRIRKKRNTNNMPTVKNMNSIELQALKPESRGVGVNIYSEDREKFNNQGARPKTR